MENFKNQFEIELELDPFKNYVNVTIEAMEENWRLVAQKVIGETDETRQIGIQTLKERAKNEQISLPFLQEKDLSRKDQQNLETLYWLKVLRSGAMDIERSWEVFMNYLNIMKNYPLYFEKAYIPTQLKLTFEQQVHTVLEKRDQYGRRVCFFRPGHWDPDVISVYDLFCGAYALSELISMETKTQITGITLIVDPKGFGFRQLRHWTLDFARNATHFVQDSFPLWYRSIHIINAPRLFLVAYNLLKQFLNERVKNSILFHDNLESLHFHVPKEILPRELGGSQGKFDNSNCSEAVYNNQLHFTRVQQFVQANTQ